MFNRLNVSDHLLLNVRTVKVEEFGNKCLLQILQMSILSCYISNVINVILLNPLSYVFSGLGAATYRLPEYKDTPDNFTYYRGERAILQCSVKYLGTKQVGRSLQMFFYVL